MTQVKAKKLGDTCGCGQVETGYRSLVHGECIQIEDRVYVATWPEDLDGDQALRWVEGSLWNFTAAGDRRASRHTVSVARFKPYSPLIDAMVQAVWESLP